jgi:hypothetical protein
MKLGNHRMWTGENIPGWVSMQEGQNIISTHTCRPLLSGPFRSGFQPHKQKFMVFLLTQARCNVHKYVLCDELINKWY